MKTNYPVFLKGITALVFTIALGMMVFIRAGKSKESFQKIEGIITSFSNTNKSFPGKDPAKFRYLQIDHYYKTFELFIGKGAGDFKPDFEKVDNLKPGDSVTIYYDENYNTRSDPINRLAYFIYRGKEAIFIKGSGEKYLAYFIIGLSVILILVLLILKRKGKIT